MGTLPAVRSIHLDYSISSSQLVQKLVAEGGTAGSATSLPRLGTCIRRITVATHPGWVTHRHGVGLRNQEFTELAEDEKTQRTVDASNAFFGQYIASIEAILNFAVLPHLELLDWKDKIVLQRSFFETLALSPVKYLKLFRVAIDHQFNITLQEPFTTYQWPLRTLYLELGPHYGLVGEVSTSPLSESILRLCSPTLEDLILRSTCDHEDPYAFTDPTVDALPQFPNLRRLCIQYVNLKDSTVLQALVQDGLRYLEVDFIDAIYAKFFEHRGTIPTLETFVWTGYPDESPYQFLQENPQIATLALPMAVSSTTLEEKIVPLLIDRFRNLTSLSLVWQGVSIPDSAMQKIALLKTLKQIHLSAGNQFGWKHDWLINHESLRHYLRALPLLEKIAFSRDCYDSLFSLEPQGTYYLEVEDVGNRAESQHRQRILDEASKYVSAFDRLGWIYFGQIPMNVDTRHRPAMRNVRALSEERDSCYTLLSKFFGGTTD